MFNQHSESEHQSCDQPVVQNNDTTVILLNSLLLGYFCSCCAEVCLSGRNQMMLFED